MRIDLNGKTALVTGSGRGIGQAIANAFRDNGATVVYSDVDAESAREASGPGGIALELDVTNQEQVNSVVPKIAAEHGLDILVNNAGVNTLAHRVTTDEFPREEWDRVLSVDLDGLFQVSKVGAGELKKRGGGRIINIASIGGLVPLRLQCAFIAAKAGVVNFTKAMAIELAKDGIIVNGIAPGSTLTEQTRQLFYGDDGKFRESMQELLDHIPMGRPGEVEEIAQAALFLADPDNSYVTGHILVVDGGWTAGYVRNF